MREIRSVVVIACALAACKGQSGTTAKQGSAPPEGSDDTAEPTEVAKQEGEIPVVLGDCALATTPFISGPEPQAFKPEDLARPATALTATMADGGDIAAGFVRPEKLDIGHIRTIGHGRGTGQGYGLGGGGLGGGGGTGVGYGGRVGGIPGGCGPGMDGMEVRTPGGGTGICGRYAAIPSVTVGEPTVQPLVASVTYDKKLVRRYIKRNVQKLSYCYEKQLLVKPDLKGTVTANFVITPAGSVATANADGVDPEVSSCVAHVIMGIEFPKPTDGVVKVTFPFTFKPSGDNDFVPVTPKPKTPKVVLPLVPAAKPYQPGAGSALAELRIGLTDCFRRQDKHSAALVFDLEPGKISATGIDNPAFTKCVAELGPQVKVTAPTRCSATFGTATVESLPAVDITTDSISFLGKPLLAPITTGAKKKPPWWEIESLTQVARANVEATRATKAALTLHGPLVVRPLPATTMITVERVVHTLIAAGEDPVLAAQRNGTWQLLRNYPLPVVPVPIGTGGSWSSDLARREVVNWPEPPILLVEHDYVLIRPLEKQVKLDKLGDELKALKADKRYADRDDIWVTANDKVPYSLVVEVIDKADAAGFRRWSLTSAVVAGLGPY